MRSIFINKVCELRGAVAPCESGARRTPCGHSARVEALSQWRREPCAEIRRVEVLSMRRRADSSLPAALCEDRARRSALAAAPFKCVLSLANALRRSCVSKRSRCGAARIRHWPRRALCEDCARRSAVQMRFELGTLCGGRVCRSALAVASCKTCSGRGDACAEIARVEALGAALCEFPACFVSGAAFGSCLGSRARFHTRARSRSPPASPARKSQVLITIVAHKARSCSSSGVNFATSKRKSSAGSALP